MTDGRAYLMTGGKPDEGVTRRLRRSAFMAATLSGRLACYIRTGRVPDDLMGAFIFDECSVCGGIAAPMLGWRPVLRAAGHVSPLPCSGIGVERECAYSRGER